MPTPFPGMDPYLEQRSLWPDVHNSLITALRDDLAPRLRPRYFVAVEERTYSDNSGALTFAGRPDLAVSQVREAAVAYWVAPQVRQAGVAVVELPIPDIERETYLEIRDQDDRVVTVLEILSPANKVAGKGRDLCQRKRSRLLNSRTHLVEIDLLRAGQPMEMHGDYAPSHYRILVSREAKRPRAELYYFNVGDLIPDFPLPLQPDEAEPVVALNQLLHDLYYRAGYDLRIDYSQSLDPPLDEEYADWTADLLRQAGHS